MLLREIQAIEIESAVDRARREDREEREAALRRAERDLVRGSSVSAAARELLQAVRRLMVTMGVEMQTTMGLGRDQLRGAGQQLRREAVEDRRRQHGQAQEIPAAPVLRVHVSQAVPEQKPKQEQRIEPPPLKPGPVLTALPDLTPPSPRRTLKQINEEEAAKVRIARPEPQPARRMERVLHMEPRSHRRRSEDEPL